MVVLSPLPKGSIQPLYWSLIAIVSSILVLTVLWEAWRLRLSAGARGAADRLLPLPAAAWRWPAGLFAAALVWGILQALPIWPRGIAHPLWWEAALLAGESAPLVAPISASPGQTIDALLRLSAYGLVFFATAQVAAASGRLAWRLLAAVAAAAALWALAALAAFWAGDAALFPLGAEKSAYLGRLTGPFVNANLFASYAGLGLVVAAAFALRAVAHADYRESGRGARHRFAAAFARRGGAAVAAIAVLALALAFTGSRGGLLAALAGLGALAVLAPSAGQTRAAAISVLAAAAAALAAALAFTPAGALLGTRMTQGEASFTERLEVYRTTLEMIASAPLTGHGYGAFPDAFPAFRGEALRSGLPFVDAHNSWLETAAGLGLPGAAALFAALVWVAIRCARGAARRRRHRLIPAVAAAAAALAGAHALVDVPVQMPAVALTLAVLMGAGYGQAFTTAERRSWAG